MPEIDEAASRTELVTVNDEAEARREFLKTVAKGATVAPAVAMLLTAVSKPMKARAQTYGGCGCGSIL